MESSCHGSSSTSWKQPLSSLICGRLHEIPSVSLPEDARQPGTCKASVPHPAGLPSQASSTAVVTPERALGLFQIKGPPPSAPGQPCRELIDTEPLSDCIPSGKGGSYFQSPPLFPQAFQEGLCSLLITEMTLDRAGVQGTWRQGAGLPAAWVWWKGPGSLSHRWNNGGEFRGGPVRKAVPGREGGALSRPRPSSLLNCGC